MRIESWLRNLFRRLSAGHNRRDANRRSNSNSSNRIALIEPLEYRRLLSAATVGFETRVNTYVPGNDSLASTAMDAAGDYVVAWTSSGEDGSGFGVYAQRYSAAGVAQSSEFRVNTYTTGNQLDPKVAMDAGGDFVVTWQSAGQDGSGYGVFAQRYNSAGVAQGTEFQVNTNTTGNQVQPAVAMDSAGDFAITWASNGQDGSGYGIYAQRYNSSGVAQGTEFRANTYTTGAQFRPAIAMDGAGDFVIAWSSFGQDGSNYGIYAQRYNSAGISSLGMEFQVNTFTTGSQVNPAVSMDTAGDFVIVWQSLNQDGSNYGIYGQLYTKAESPVGVEFQINTYTTGDQSIPRAAMDATGDFAVVWNSLNQDGSGFGVYGQRFVSGGAADGGEFRISTTTLSNQEFPTIASDATGDLIVAWQSQGQDSSTNIYSQQYTPATAGPIVTGVRYGTSILSPNERLSQSVYGLTVDFSDPMSTVGSTTGVNSVVNPANWVLLRNGVVLHNKINSVGYVYNPVTNRNEATVLFSGALTDGLFQLVAYPTIQSAAGVPLDGNGTAAGGGNFQFSFFVAQVVASGGEVQVNTYTTGNHNTPAIATDAAGDYVIVWANQNQDGSGYGVYGQRYNASGTAQGTEFQVNTYTTGDQKLPAVAMDSVGDFVVTWESSSEDGSGFGIYARRYNAAGIAQGGEFQVNVYTTGAQVSPSIAMDQAGDFVIAWTTATEDGSGYGVYARRYAATGAALGGEFQINTYTTGNQNDSSVAMDAVGDFVIAWESMGEDGSGYGVYAQRYSSFGVPIGSEFQVNTYTTGDQGETSVAMDAAGDFVIAWSSYKQDGSGFGIYAQRYTDEGLTNGPEYRVNQYTTQNQFVPHVSMDAVGDFAVVWDSYGQDGSQFGVYYRYSNAAAIAVPDALVNTTTTDSQLFGAIAMDSQGDFVVAWTSNTSGTYEIQAQQYKTDVSPLLYGMDVTPLNATATIQTPVAPTLLAYDEDNNNWSGATIQITSDYVNGTDVLGFVNELGITGSWNAVTGTLTLSGVSSVSNYRSALESVTYDDTNPGLNSSLTRAVTFIANDGLLDSDPVTREINVITTSTPAVLSGVSGTGTYTEDALPIAVAANLVISDPGTLDLASATVSFTNWQAEDRLNFNNIFALQHTFTQNLAAQTATFTITGLDTVDHYQTLLRSVEYWDVSDNAVTSNRVATFTVTDGLTTSNAVVRDIAVARYNHPPVVSGIETTPLAYQANDPALPPQPISGTLLIGDPDSNNCSKAVVQITSGYENDANGKDVLSFVNQLGIIGAWNATTGTLTLTGTSSDSNYRAALRSVMFSSSGSNVSTAIRTLTITATDDFSPTPATSLPVTRTVSVSTTDIPPSLSGIATTSLSYTRGTAAVAVAPGVYVLTPDSINMAQAIVQITGNYQSGQDVLAFTSGFGVTGSFNATTGTLTLTGIASVANYQTLLRSVTYKTNTSGASTLSRTISLTINDGLASSNAVTRNVTLT